MAGFWKVQEGKFEHIHRIVDFPRFSSGFASFSCLNESFPQIYLVFLKFSGNLSQEQNKLQHIGESFNLIFGLVDQF